MQRLAVWEAQQRQASVTVERREPEAVLLSALDDADTVLARIKAELSESGLSSALLDSFGIWLDRTGRLAKIVLDGGIRDKLNDRLNTISGNQANTIIQVLTIAMSDPRVVILEESPQQIIVDALDAVEAQQAVAAA